MKLSETSFKSSCVLFDHAIVLYCSCVSMCQMDLQKLFGRERRPLRKPIAKQLFNEIVIRAE